MTNADRCERCHALLTMVGRVHRCVPISDGVGEKAAPTGKSGTTASRQERVTGDQSLRAATVEASLATGPSDSKATYRYRNADKWRAYMRDHMRRKRAKNG